MNLIGCVWIGQCIECGHHPDMCLNDAALFECPSCHVQIHFEEMRGAVIMPYKGTGQFIQRNGVPVSARVEFAGIAWDEMLVGYDTRPYQLPKHSWRHAFKELLHA